MKEKSTVDKIMEIMIDLKPKIQPLLNDREEARKKKDYILADRIRIHLLNTYGVVVEDTKHGQEWRLK